MGPSELEAFLETDLATWGRLVKELGIKSR